MGCVKSSQIKIDWGWSSRVMKRRVGRATLVMGLEEINTQERTRHTLHARKVNHFSSIFKERALHRHIAVWLRGTAQSHNGWNAEKTPASHRLLRVDFLVVCRVEGLFNQRLQRIRTRCLLLLAEGSDLLLHVAGQVLVLRGAAPGSC